MIWERSFISVDAPEAYRDMAYQILLMLGYSRNLAADVEDCPGAFIPLPGDYFGYFPEAIKGYCDNDVDEDGNYAWEIYEDAFPIDVGSAQKLFYLLNTLCGPVRVGWEENNACTNDDSSSADAAIWDAAALTRTTLWESYDEGESNHFSETEHDPIRLRTSGADELRSLISMAVRRNRPEIAEWIAARAKDIVGDVSDLLTPAEK